MGTAICKGDITGAITGGRVFNNQAPPKKRPINHVGGFENETISSKENNLQRWETVRR
jgi:hypothetical protein